MFFLIFSDADIYLQRTSLFVGVTQSRGYAFWLLGGLRLLIERDFRLPQLISYIITLQSRKACANAEPHVNAKPPHPSHELTYFPGIDFTILLIPDSSAKLSNSVS